jgi:ketopantoate reductase
MSFFFNGLEEFFDKYHISHPIIKELHDIAEKDTFIGIIKNGLGTKPMKIEEHSADFHSEDVKAIVESLIEQGYVIHNEQGEFSLAEDKSRQLNSTTIPPQAAHSIEIIVEKLYPIDRMLLFSREQTQFLC